MLSGNIKAFSGIQQLNSLELKGTEISGDLEVFREDNLDRPRMGLPQMVVKNQSLDGV